MFDPDLDNVIGLLEKVTQKALSSRRKWRHDPRLGGTPSVKARANQLMKSVR